MPREDRRIYFDYEETYKAIYQLCTQKGLPKPPSGMITRVDANLENPLELDVFIEGANSSILDPTNYTKDFIVAALMILCRNIGIPLPKGANKVLELAPGKVILRVQMIR